MAYNEPLDGTGRSILVQVAHKGAVSAATAGGVFDETVYLTAFDNMVEALVAKVEEQQANVPAPAAPSAPQSGGQNAPAGTTPGAAGEVKILGKQNGPVDAWLIEAAQKAGVTAVFDNRDRAAGTKQPHYRTPKDASKRGEPDDMPFWPPRP